MRLSKYNIMNIICRRFADYTSFRGGSVSVKHSLQLLDRLAESVLVVTGTDGCNGSNIQEQHLQQQQQHQPLMEQSVEPLNDVLTRWRDEYLQSPKDTVHPRQVLEKVDKWKEMVNTCNSIRKEKNYQQQYQRQHGLERLVRPDLNSYMCILQAVADNVDTNLDRKNRNSLHFVHTLLERLVEESTTDFSIQPNVASFATVMNAYVKLTVNNADINNKNNENYGFSSSAKVEELLNRMQHLAAEGWHNLQPNVVIYNILFNAWAKEGKIEKIEMTLQRMIRLEIAGVSPDPVSYSTLLSAYSKSEKPESVLKADSLLEQMLELYSHGMESAKPNVISFSNVMQCYANVGNGSKAEQWLRRLQDIYHKRGTDDNIHLHHHGHDPDMKPDVALYNTVLLAWAKSGQPQNAEEFLRYMLVMDDEGNTTDDFDNNIRPNSRSFNIVLSAWAKIGEVERAESILLEMHQLHVEQNLDTRPTVVSYNTVLDTYAKKATKRMHSDERENINKHNIGKTKRKKTRNCEEDEPWNRAEAILNHMLELYRAGDLGVKPTARTWNTVINVCAKGGKIELAESILDRLISFSTSSDGMEENIHPSIRTWNTLLSGCMTQGNVRQAKHFWWLMKEGGIQPDIVTYNTLLNCYVRSSNANTKTQNDVDTILNELRHDHNVIANHITYLAMVNFWINQRKPKKAELFLVNIAEKHQQSNNNTKIYNNEILPPDRTLFHKIMFGWVRHKEPKEAEKLLLKMVELSDNGFDIRPNTETYNRLLSCWAKSMKFESGERAEVILREMEGLARAGDENVTPDLYSYNSVLDAWSNSGDATALTRIDKLILEMLLRRNPSILPDSISYGTWLRTITASGEADKERRVKEVVKTMKIHNFSPNEYVRQRLGKFLDSIR